MEKHLAEPWFTLTEEYIKTVEARLNRGEYKKLKKGDFIVWFNNEYGKVRRFEVKVIDIRHYETFGDMLKSEKVKNVLPGIARIDHGIYVYYQFFTPEDEDKYGVIAIETKPVIKMSTKN